MKMLLSISKLREEIYFKALLIADKEEIDEKYFLIYSNHLNYLEDRDVAISFKNDLQLLLASIDDCIKESPKVVKTDSVKH